MVAARRKNTSVWVSAETLMKLKNLKHEYGVKTMDELLNMMLEQLTMCREAEIQNNVRKTMCNDFSEARASLTAWGKILARKFATTKEVALAIEFLTPDPATGEYVVNKDKCMNA